MRAGFWWGELKERDRLKDTGIEGGIIVRCILRKWEGEVDWIDLAQYRDRWQALVNVVMNLKVA